MRAAGLVSLLFFLLATAHADAPARSSDGFEYLAGTWESEARGNAYQLAVAWNPRSTRFEGTLARATPATQRDGYTVGEVCLLVMPTADRRSLHVIEAFHPPGHRPVQWRHISVPVDATTSARLRTSTTTLRHLAKAETPPPLAMGTALLGATALAKPYPTVEEVKQAVTGKDPVDTAARRAAAFNHLIVILRTNWGTEPARPLSPDQIALAERYASAAAEADREGESALAHGGAPLTGDDSYVKRWFKLRTGYDGDKDGVLAVAVGGAKDDLEALRTTHPDEDLATPIAAKALEVLKRVAAAPAAWAPPQPDPSVAKARGQRIDTNIFGVRLGEPYLIPSASGEVAVELPQRPPWADSVTATIDHDVLRRVTITTRLGAMEALRAKYGQPRSGKDGALEWFFPGLHVRFMAPHLVIETESLYLNAKL